MTWIRADRIFGIGILAFAGFYGYQASLIQESFFSDVLGPKFFPYVLVAILVGCALMMMLQPEQGEAWPRGARLAEIAAAVAVMLLYALLLSEIGFVAATFLASGWLTWRLGTAPLMAVVVGLSIAVGLYVLFAVILGLSLARGPLGF